MKKLVIQGIGDELVDLGIVSEFLVKDFHQNRCVFSLKSYKGYVITAHMMKTELGIFIVGP